MEKVLPTVEGRELWCRGEDRGRTGNGDHVYSKNLINKMSNGTEGEILYWGRGPGPGLCTLSKEMTSQRPYIIRVFG